MRSVRNCAGRRITRRSTRCLRNRLRATPPDQAAAIAAVLAALLGFGIGAHAAEAGFGLALPLDCRPGIDCFVQNHVDRDPGPDARDFRCGALTYDGHEGTDIRLRDLAAMRAGVSVLAAAPGRVLRVRDGEPDDQGRSLDARDKGARDCGNGVILDHDDGWETQSCHLRQGSVRVKPGDRVERGDTLGQVGLSGRTQFPHLHLGVRRHGEVVDPYVGETTAQGCGVSETPLWAAAVTAALAYRPSALLAASFSAAVPRLTEIEAGRHHNTSLPRASEALVFWVHVLGLRRGDVLELAIARPDGRLLASNRAAAAPKDKATWYQYVGKRRADPDWPRGVYRGSFRLFRDGTPVVAIERKVSVR